MTWMLDFVEEILYAFARLANIALAVFSKRHFRLSLKLDSAVAA